MQSLPNPTHRIGEHAQGCNTITQACREIKPYILLQSGVHIGIQYHKWYSVGGGYMAFFDDTGSIPTQYTFFFSHSVLILHILA